MPESGSETTLIVRPAALPAATSMVTDPTGFELTSCAGRSAMELVIVIAKSAAAVFTALAITRMTSLGQ